MSRVLILLALAIFCVAMSFNVNAKRMEAPIVEYGAIKYEHIQDAEGNKEIRYTTDFKVRVSGLGYEVNKIYVDGLLIMSEGYSADVYGTWMLNHDGREVTIDFMDWDITYNPVPVVHVDVRETY